jgi:hypothetical protein
VGGVAGLGDCPEHPGNQRVNSGLVVQDVVVGDAENVDTAVLHVLIPGRVAGLVRMGLAIHFDHQAGVQAGEVSEVGPDGLLASEVPALFAEGPEKSPECTLRTGLVKAK